MTHTTIAKIKDEAMSYANTASRMFDGSHESINLSQQSRSNVAIKGVSNEAPPLNKIHHMNKSVSPVKNDEIHQEAI